MEKGFGLQDVLVMAKLLIVLVCTINSRSGFAVATVYSFHAKHVPRACTVTIRPVLATRRIHSESCQCWELGEDKTALSFSILRSSSYM